jgi:S-adenosylmethionine uptake transporter
LFFGFIGVLIMVRPGASAFEPAALFSLMAAVSYAARAIVNRKIGLQEKGSVMAIYGTAVYLTGAVVLSLIFSWSGLESDRPSLQFLLRAWTMPAFPHLLLISLTGLTWGFGFYLISQAYRLSNASIVAPFEFTAVPLAVIWGWLLWNEIPQITIWIGLLLVLGSGLYILYREKRKAPPLPPYRPKPWRPRRRKVGRPSTF